MTDKLRTGNPIWVYYRNQDEAYNIQPPRLFQGYYGENYHIEVPRFPRHQFLNASTDLDGTFDDQVRQIYLYYRNANWKSNEEVINYLVATEPIQLYDRPQGLPIDNHLPDGITFKSFRKVITTDRYQWYQVTAERWLEFDPDTMQLLADNPYTDHVEPTTETDFDDQMQILALNHAEAFVDFIPDHQVPCYDYVYGKELHQLAHGTNLTLLRRLTDTNGVNWYETSHHEYINALYVTMKA